jgi:hypothetical protein
MKVSRRPVLIAQLRELVVAKCSLDRRSLPIKLANPQSPRRPLFDDYRCPIATSFKQAQRYRIDLEHPQLYSEASRKMSSAAQAAPKPLSMLTTVTPLPQELSMLSSAARPPKLAP